MRGQRCREYAMTVIGMVGRGAVQGDAIREARAVNDNWKSVSSALLYRALISLREDSGMVTLCMTMVSDRIAAEAAAAPVAVPQMTTPTAPRLSKDEGRAKWLAWTTNKCQWVEAMASGQKRGPKKIIRSNRGTLSRRRRVPETGRTHARARSSVCLPPRPRTYYEAVGTTPWAKGTYPTSRGRRRPAPPGEQGRQKRP